ncbi:MAG TPA: type II toxin-antitoxin system VapC family toxin [Hyphomicrobiales bacterium]|nr:type II toxin-antitoxin system VapC family toxin [Hyphomicrobiales bacterium]
MTFVVDASVVVKWFVEEPDREAARRLLGDASPLCAPDLVFVEMANVLWRKGRRGEIAPGQHDRALDRVAAMIDLVVPSQGLMQVALAMARELDHPVYDCVYLACAEAQNATLVTADQRFVSRTRAANLSNVVLLRDLTI